MLPSLVCVRDCARRIKQQNRKKNLRIKIVFLKKLIEVLFLCCIIFNGKRSPNNFLMVSLLNNVQRAQRM